jgi:hypothetical protein
MNEGNQKAAIAGALLTVIVAIGLSIWYAGSLDAEDDVTPNTTSESPGSAAENFRRYNVQVTEEKEIFSADQQGDEMNEEEEVDFDTPAPQTPAPTPQSR